LIATPIDERDFGAPCFPVGSRETYQSVQANLVGSLSALDTIFPSRRIVRGDRAHHFDTPGTGEKAPAMLGDYLATQPICALLALRDNRILFERYRFSRTETHRFASMSVAKTFTGTLVGIAAGEGAIRSLDDKLTDYVPGLDATGFRGVTIRQTLMMASGVRFRENYGGDDDVGRFADDTFRNFGPGGLKAMLPYREQDCTPGTRFSYASLNSQALGLVLKAATGLAPADYLSSRIWKPMGAEADGSWLVDRTQQESTAIGINAVLRDYARFGALLANAGRWDGRELIPRDYFRESTNAREPLQAPGIPHPDLGYGYHVWLIPGATPQLAARGIRGQMIFADLATKTVLVQAAAFTSAFADSFLHAALSLWRVLLEQ